MSIDIVTIGGGLAGSTLAAMLARKGKKVLILEREAEFKDRVRGENLLPWGHAVARRLGFADDLIAAGAQITPWWNIYAMGQPMERRPIPQTTPHGQPILNIYHPDLQKALLANAVKAGAEVNRGAVVNGISEKDGKWTVSYTQGGQAHSVSPRVVVGADGRFSKVREWGGFDVKRDPDNLRIAGAMVLGSCVPDDGSYLGLGPGIAAFVAPLGNKRARMYFVYIGAMGDRKLSGKDKIPEFVEGLRSSMLPKEWFDGIEVTGPLAEFEGADSWVTSASKPGLALIGDAAGATDPCWGCGLSKTFVDVEALSNRLTETDDWDLALKKYAADHDDHWTKLHNILSWMTTLIWTGGPEADARRERVFPRMKQDPSEFPDAIGLGPFGPSNERARQLLLGEVS